jgi:hypothetical protein
MFGCTEYSGNASCEKWQVFARKSFDKAKRAVAMAELKALYNRQHVQSDRLRDQKLKPGNQPSM